MEAVDAELGGWTSAPYPTKADVDASYKRLLDRLLGRRDGPRSGGRRRQPQPLRRGVGAGRDPPAPTHRRRRDRDARGDGPAAGASDAGGSRTSAAVHPGGHRRRLRGQHRLPRPPPRRERRARELPARAVHDPARIAGMGGPTGPLRARRREPSRGVDDAAPRSGPHHRAPHVRTRRGVRQRAGHRLHPARQPGLDRAPPRDRPPGPPPSLGDHRRRHRRHRRTGPGRGRPLAGDVDGGAPRVPVPAGRGDGRRSRADDRRDGARDGQDGARGRSRGLRGDRLRERGRRRARDSWTSSSRPASRPTHSASCSSPGRGTSPWRSPPTASWRHWPAATRCC